MYVLLQGLLINAAYDCAWDIAIRDSRFCSKNPQLLLRFLSMKLPCSLLKNWNLQRNDCSSPEAWLSEIHFLMYRHQDQLHLKIPQQLNCSSALKARQGPPYTTQLLFCFSFILANLHSNSAPFFPHFAAIVQWQGVLNITYSHLLVGDTGWKNTSRWSVMLQLATVNIYSFPLT